METNFDMDNFEQTLKQHADQFSMIPSKRVWNGVYNSLHPGSRWPSLSMLLFFLLTLVGIGPLNQSSKNYTVATLPLPDNIQSSLTEENESKVFSLNTYSKPGSQLSEEKLTGKVIYLKNTSTQSNSEQNNPLEKQTSAQNNSDQNNPVGNQLPVHKDASESNKIPGYTNKDSQKSSLILSEDALQEGKKFEKKVSDDLVVNFPNFKQDQTSTDFAKGIIVDQVADKHHSIILNENLIVDNARSLESFLKSNAGNSILIGIEDMNNDDEENETTTDVTTLKKTTKRNSKTTWIFFATPAITTTYFTGKSPESIPINVSPLIVNPSQISNTMRYNARVGLSIGAEINHEVATKWEIVSGMQLSYSGYNILAHKVHPTFSYLYLRDDNNLMEAKKYITYYGSGEGLDEVVLHNNSFQLSIPVGVKHSVWKNNNVEIKIGASLQPSLVVKGQAYILSSDGRNYVNDPELMREVNLSGEFNSSISFQGEKVKWHVGPTIRYQAMSSYKKIYPVNEHLIDYGIRIGISK